MLTKRRATQGHRGVLGSHLEHSTKKLGAYVSEERVIHMEPSQVGVFFPQMRFEGGASSPSQVQPSNVLASIGSNYNDVKEFDIAKAAMGVLDDPAGLQIVNMNNHRIDSEPIKATIVFGMVVRSDYPFHFAITRLSLSNYASRQYLHSKSP